MGNITRSWRAILGLGWGKSSQVARQHHACTLSTNFWLFRHRRSLLPRSGWGLMRIGCCLAPLGSLRIGGGGRVERSLWRWGSFPLHWRGGREAGLLRQRQIRRLIHWPWLLHIVVNGWLASVTNGELGLSLPLPLAASDRAVDETATREERAAQQCRVAVLATEAGVCGVPMLALVAHLPLVHP